MDFSSLSRNVGYGFVFYVYTYIRKNWQYKAGIEIVFGNDEGWKK